MLNFIKESLDQIPFFVKHAITHEDLLPRILADGGLRLLADDQLPLSLPRQRNLLLAAVSATAAAE